MDNETARGNICGDDAFLRTPGDKIALVVFGIWIFGVSSFYFIRFTFEFYYANQAAMDGLIQALRR